MIEYLNKVYQSNDLYGDCLFQPLKQYHQFFASKIKDSSGLQKAAWVIANIATGIFTYPTLGLLASIGMLVKLVSAYDVQRHNKSQKVHLDVIKAGISSCETYSDITTHEIEKSGWKMNELKYYQVNKANVNIVFESIMADINDLSLFRKIYVASSPILNAGGGIRISLNTMERA